MHTHQNQPDRLASARQEPAGTRRVVAERLRAVDCIAFSDSIRSLARRLYFSTPRASKADRQFLQDLARAEVRVQMKQLQHLIAIAADSTRPEDRVALVDLVSKHVDVQRECLDVVIASDIETAVQGEGDVAIRQFERHRTRATKERALASLRRHFAALRALIDSVEAHPVQ